MKLREEVQRFTHGLGPILSTCKMILYTQQLSAHLCSLEMPKKLYFSIFQIFTLKRVPKLKGEKKNSKLGLNICSSLGWK